MTISKNEEIFEKITCRIEESNEEYDSTNYFIEGYKLNMYFIHENSILTLNKAKDLKIKSLEKRGNETYFTKEIWYIGIITIWTAIIITLIYTK